MTRRGRFYTATMLLIAGCAESEKNDVVTSPPQLPVVRDTDVDNDDVEPLPEPVIAPIPVEHLGPAELVDVILDAATRASTRLRAAGRLGRIGSAATSEVSRLEPALQSEIADVQLAAAMGLVGLGREEDDVIPILIAGLSQKNPNVRIAVLNVLGSVGERGQSATPAMITLLSSGQGSVCQSAAFALHAVGVKTEYLPALLKQLENEKARPYVLDVITSMRKNAVGAVPQLIELLGTDDDLVRSRLGYALAAIGKPAIPALTELIADEQRDEAKRIAAAAALGTMGRIATDALPELRAVQAASTPRVGEAIRGAIVLIEAK